MNQYNELFGALAKAQAEMETAAMNSTNPFFKSKYADFSDIVRASRPALTKYGLCVIQRVISNENGMELCTTLGHSSGQYIESMIKITPPKSDPQSLGSCLSYLKRYSYAAICGVLVSDEDDDGETNMQETRNLTQQKTNNNIPRITFEQHEHLQKELDGYPDVGEALLNTMKKKYSTLNIQELTEIPKSEFYYILEVIKKNKNV